MTTTDRPPGPSSRRTVAESLGVVGEQVRALRRRAGLSQAEVARRAEVSLSTVKGLEAGNGTNLTSVVRVVRVLGRDDWLDLLDAVEEPSISPMRILGNRTQSP